MVRQVTAGVRLLWLAHTTGPANCIEYARLQNLGLKRSVVSCLTLKVAGVFSRGIGGCYFRVIGESFLFADAKQREAKVGLSKNKIGHAWFDTEADERNYDLVLRFPAQA